MAAAEKHTQEYERTKLARPDRKDKESDLVNVGEVVIGDLVDSIVALIFMAIDPRGRRGALVDIFLCFSDPHNTSRKMMHSGMP